MRTDKGLKKRVASRPALLALAGVAVVATGRGPEEAVAAGAPNGDRNVNSFERPDAAFDPETHPGKALFEENCAMCHLGGVPKAPHREFLEMMPPEGILHALNEGVMQQQAEHLGADERRQITEFLTRTDLASYKPAPGPQMCTGKAAEFDLTRPPAQVGWGYDTRRFTPAIVAKLGKEDVPRLKRKWSFAFPGALRARSQPVAAMGAVFVGSQDGTIYAFDLETGCARWTSKVTAEVRTAIVVEPWAEGQKPARNPRLFFGDLMGRVYAMDALTGQVLWRVRPDDHANATITGTPLLHGDTLYVPVSSLEVVTAADPNYACCTFRGSVVALDIETGAEKWTHFTVPNPPTEQGKTAVGTPILGPSGAAVWTSPTLDLKRGVLYHGSSENYSSPADDNSDAVFAVDLKTGKRRWHHQLLAGDAWNSTCVMKDHPNCPVEKGPDFDLSASILVIDIGGGKDVLIAAPKSGMMTALDPDTGQRLWQTRVGRGSMQGGVHFGMAAEGTRIYVPITDMTEDSLGRPIQEPGRSGLHAVDARTGKILWSALSPDTCGGRKYCDPGISAAATAMPGVVFAGGMDGWLRAYEGETGRVLWEVDTTRPVETANGMVARGGSMSGPGPLIVDGHVVVNSGYGFSFHMPGNALHVYSVDGK
ncbi:outer membrane protein assembly factor BamB family protein [Pedomonas sp. V897]|uniref:outer membrane protein assembly factor BamB family protein n=1 Tax=Pedomonas sp. V897 TaxID=3446482 RepID=UPI003EDFBE50